MDESQKYSVEARETLAMFLAPHPEITHDFHKQQIARSVEHYLLKSRSKEVTKDILVQALEDRYPHNEPSTLRLRDPEALMGTIQQLQAVDPKKPLAKATRWSAPKTISAPAGNDVFAFYAGSRKGGNTDRILDTVLEGTRITGGRVEKVSFADKNLSPCKGCLGCQQEKLESHCAIQDDMPFIYKRFLECDTFVFGFSVYTGRENAQTAIFCDRLKALTDPWQKAKFKPRRGLIVATWGWPSDQIYAGVVSQIATNLNSFGVEVVEVITGSGFWNAYYEKGSCDLDPEGMRLAGEAGKRLMG